MRFGWVGADAGYGSGPDFLFSLADAGHTFLIDVHKSFVIYGVDPQPKPGPSTKGRTPNRSISELNTLSVEGVGARLPHKRLEGLQREGNDSGLTQTSGLT